MKTGARGAAYSLLVTTEASFVMLEDGVPHTRRGMGGGGQYCTARHRPSPCGGVQYYRMYLPPDGQAGVTLALAISSWKSSTA